jgi:hypothetical protein
MEHHQAMTGTFSHSFHSTMHILPWHLITTISLICLAVGTAASLVIGTYTWLRLRHEPRA